MAKLGDAGDELDDARNALENTADFFEDLDQGLVDSVDCRVVVVAFDTIMTPLCGDFGNRLLVQGIFLTFVGLFLFVAAIFCVCSLPFHRVLLCNGSSQQ